MKQITKMVNCESQPSCHFVLPSTGASVVWAILATAGFLLGPLSIRSALAQPALERLERQVRDQTASKAKKDKPGKPSDDDGIGYLGIVADDRDVSGLGVRIVEVAAGGPADKAGLKLGDLVTKIGDRLVRDLDDFAAALHNMPAGRKLRFTVERDFEPRRIEVTLGKRPPEEKRLAPEFGRIGDPTAAAPPRMSLLGVRVEDVDAQVQADAGLPDARGAVVTHVTEGSPADLAKVPLRAVIVAVNGKEVDSPASLKRLIAAAGPGKEIRLDYYHRGKLVERTLRLAEVLEPEGGVAPAAANEPVADSQKPSEEPEPLTDQERIERLEERVRQLEARLNEFERLLSKPPGRAR
ncbi:MAG TPA: PDZ domain-containing protein [Pirellulales bacterium]|nr:PDZ domain-containing protein [Pirellulales bacterium]